MAYVDGLRQDDSFNFAQFFKIMDFAWIYLYLP